MRWKVVRARRQEHRRAARPVDHRHQHRRIPRRLEPHVEPGVQHMVTAGLIQQSVAPLEPFEHRSSKRVSGDGFPAQTPSGNVAPLECARPAGRPSSVASSTKSYITARVTSASKPTAHEQVRLHPVGLFLPLEAQRVLRPGLHHVADIRAERQHLIRALARDRHFHGEKMRVLDLDRQLLDPASRGRSSRPRPCAARSRTAAPAACGRSAFRHGSPGAVGADGHVGVAAMVGVPLLDRRHARARPLGPRDQRLQTPESFLRGRVRR